MLCIVIVFGVHSLVDWTWYVPGDALAALLCAGWLAGRGPLGAPAPARLDGGAARSRPEHDGGTWRERPAGPARRTHPLRIGAAVAVVAFALLAAWSQWQPQRSEAARQEALELAAAGRPLNALAEARTAVDRDRLSALALFTLAQVQQVAGHPAQARATLERAVRDQPANPQTWLTLGRYDLRIRPRAAVRELTAAIYLDPESIAPEVLARGDREAIAIHNEYIEALKAASRPARPARLRSARGRRGRATHAARRASRRRPGR
jgi:tetratricopeptide (TPR) repeat protein